MLGGRPERPEKNGVRIMKKLPRIRQGKKYFTYMTLISVLTLSACATPLRLNEFKSDGCSLFFDKSPFSDKDWIECCYKHDLAYWRGGTKEERKRADIKLKECIYEKTNDANLAEQMYYGVRLGGSAYFPTWYRWGYGWTYGRGYQPLSPEEEKLVREKIIEYRNAKSSIERDGRRINGSHRAK